MVEKLYLLLATVLPSGDEKWVLFYRVVDVVYSVAVGRYP